MSTVEATLRSRMDSLPAAKGEQEQEVSQCRASLESFECLRAVFEEKQRIECNLPSFESEKLDADRAVRDARIACSSAWQRADTLDREIAILVEAVRMFDEVERIGAEMAEKERIVKTLKARLAVSCGRPSPSLESVRLESQNLIARIADIDSALQAMEEERTRHTAHQY
eukprot:Polyplicarium_translucidae@DN3345_c5_g5_i1.p2